MFWLVGLLLLIIVLCAYGVLYYDGFFCLLSLLYYYIHCYQKVGFSAGGGDVMGLPNILM